MITATSSRLMLWRALPFVLALLVLLLAAALRLHDLGAQSLWNDEGNSFVQATRSFTDIADHAARDIHPPGYYWLLALWRLLAGETEFALRALSAFASLLSVAVTFALGRRLFGVWIGLLAALLVTLNTFSLYYAQEARMYSLLALWAVLSLWAWVGLARSFFSSPARLSHDIRVAITGEGAGPSESPLALYGRGDLGVRVEGRHRTVSSLRAGMVWGVILAGVNAAGMWTHFSYPLVMLTQGALTLVCLAQIPAGRVRLLVGYVLANLLTLALFLPWLPTALAQLSGWGQPADPTPLPDALGEILNLLTFGITHAESSPGALAIANFLLVFGLLPRRGRLRLWLLLPVLWVIVAVGVFLAFDLFRPGNLKFLLPAQIGLALWLARGVGVLWQRAGQSRENGQARLILFRSAAVVGTVWLVFNLTAGIVPLYSDPAYRRADYRALVRDIEADLRAGDVIILNAPNQAEVFHYYYRADAAVYPLPAGLGGDDAATRAAVDTLVEAYERAFVVLWGEAERDPNRIVETTLDAATYEVSDRWYGDVRLARYVMPAEMRAPVEVGARFGESILLDSYALASETVAAGEVLQLQLNWMTDAPLDTRYKVFVQLLDEEGILVAQRDSEPGGGLALTTTWQPGATIADRHGLLIPPPLASAHYLLIVGLYTMNDAGARLAVNGDTYLALTTVTVTSGE